ncbi:pyridoxamine 5'-phosphate oxidase family protein [Streptococcus phocae subsp. salmonis]|uniref:pyridoxamine 5'-phosphate oxidase family protein n=1 Tax=Streptococcus phocae TaxID=119224 RepID=UPI000530F00C|nr:pyridoxamine 5'-phosphate oxidase family protein [Streptococcus phocae]KGR73383.1 pyridoxamine 5'-phosphate oxidase family protein [Streptococcus phocae subsp. salmonis]
MLNEEMKEMIASQLAMVATVDSQGNPNIGPKRSMRLLDDQTLIFNENTGGQTQSNIEANGKIEVAYVNREALRGYRFVGRAEMVTEGPAYDAAKEWAEGKMGVPKAAGVIHIEAIYSLHSGAEAGKKVSH